MSKLPPNLETLVQDKSEDEIKEALHEFMGKLYKPEENCEQGDCEDLTCPACNSKLVTVFGTLPLEVQCTECSKKYVLRELLLPWL